MHLFKYICLLYDRGSEHRMLPQSGVELGVAGRPAPGIDCGVTHCHSARELWLVAQGPEVNMHEYHRVLLKTNEPEDR